MTHRRILLLLRFSAVLIPLLLQSLSCLSRAIKHSSPKLFWRDFIVHKLIIGPLFIPLESLNICSGSSFAERNQSSLLCWRMRALLSVCESAQDGGCNGEAQPKQGSETSLGKQLQSDQAHQIQKIYILKYVWLAHNLTHTRTQKLNLLIRCLLWTAKKEEGWQISWQRTLYD